MLIVKKQLTAFALLLLVALPLFFSLGIYIKKQLIQHRRAERFKTELLVVVNLKASEVNWVKPGKEIQVGGKLFDVKSYKANGSNIVFTGFFDSKEDKLVRHARLIQQQKTKSDNPINQSVAKFLFLPIFKEPTGFTIQNNWFFIFNVFPKYMESLSSIPYPTIAPPPKYC
jgi:hypothetical protein